MKQRFSEWWDALTFWAIARRQQWRDAAHNDDVVVAILLRQAMNKNKVPESHREP